MSRRRAPSSTPAPTNSVKQKPNVILDSGAFTAWRSGKPIDIRAYCRYIKDNLDWVSHYAALDVINPNDPEAAAAASAENYALMRKEGLRPMPIYHVGERTDWLKRMLDAGATYIGLSASSIASRGSVDPWYELMWEHLCTADGLPIVHTHAFGEGRAASLLRGPWQSADTATWMHSASRAGVIRAQNGLRLSQRNDNAAARHAPDIAHLDETNRAQWEAFCAEVTLRPDTFAILDKKERGSNSTSELVRLYLAAKHYQVLETKVRARSPIIYHPHGLLPFFGISENKHAELAPFNLHLVVDHAKPAAAGIHAGLANYLVSYAYCGDKLRTERFRKLANHDASLWDDPTWGLHLKNLQQFRTEDFKC